MVASTRTACSGECTQSGTANGHQHGSICVGGLKSFGGIIAAVQILKGDRTQNDTLRVVKKIALGALRRPDPQGSFTDTMSPDSSWTYSVSACVWSTRAGGH